MKIHIIVLCACAMVALMGCTGGNSQKSAVKRVRVEVVGQGSDGATLQLPGKVKAAEDVSIAFRVSGTIARYHVAEGATVRKGDLLVILDDSDYRVQLTAVEAEHAAVKAEAERVIALYADSVATPNDYDRAVYGLAQMEAKLQHARDELAYTRIYAPFSGTVQEHLFDGSETVAAGVPVVAMVGNGAPEVEVNLPAAEYAERDAFAAYSCTVAVFDGVTYSLTPVSIAPKATATGLYTMRLAVTADGTPQPSPGMNALVTITKRSATDSGVTVSTSAVLTTNGQSATFIYDEKEGVVHKTPVKVTSLAADGTCTVEGSIPQGAKVVSQGVRYLSDGDSVQVIAPVTATNVGGLL